MLRCGSHGAGTTFYGYYRKCYSFYNKGVISEKFQSYSIGKNSEKITSAEIGNLYDDLEDQLFATICFVEMIEKYKNSNYQINELYQKKITLINMYKTDNKDFKRDFSVESAKLIIADIVKAATVNEENLQFIRYSLMRLLKKITIDEGKITFHWSFI